MPIVQQLKTAIGPLLPGLVLAALVLLSLVALRFALRKAGGAEKLKLPSALLGIYLFTSALVVLASLYWDQVSGTLHLLSLFVLGLAVILALAFLVFDYIFGHLRGVYSPKIIKDFLVIVVYVVTIFVLLGRHGVDLTSILTTSAVLTAIIGFALQDLLSNIISGLALQIERPFNIGDWVKFGDQEGQILEANWRSTKIETLHSDIVVVPNNIITKSALINMSVPTPVHRRKLTIGLRYEAAPNRVKASILAAVRGVPGVLEEPAPFVLLRSYDDFSISYRLHFFVDHLRAKERIEDRVYTRLWYQLKRDGLSIPFPIRDVNLREVKPEQEQAARERQLARVRDALAEVGFFSALNKDELRRLAQGIRVEFYAADEAVIREGKAGDSFFLLMEGEVEVRVGVEERSVARLGPGDHFGEMSLMTGAPRAATVVALSDTECYVVDKACFQDIIGQNQQLVEQVVEQLEERRRSLEYSPEEHTFNELANNEKKAHMGARIRRFFGL